MRGVAIQHVQGADLFICEYGLADTVSKVLALQDVLGEGLHCARRHWQQLACAAIVFPNMS